MAHLVTCLALSVWRMRFTCGIALWSIAGGCTEPSRAAPTSAPGIADKALVVAETPPSLAQVKERARTSLNADETLSPLLPGTWPVDTSAPQLLFLTFQHEALPTGRVAFRVRGPLRVLRLTLKEAAPRVETVEDTQQQAVVEDNVARDEALSASELALFEALSGQKNMEAVHGELSRGYCEALSAEPLRSAVEQRATAFVQWLGCKQ